MATSSSELVRELKQAAQQKLVTSFFGTGIVGQALTKRFAEKNKVSNDPINKAMSEQNAVQNQVNATAVKIEPIVRSIARTVNTLARVWAKHVYAKQEALRLQRERLSKERALAEEDENERKQAEQQAVQKESLTGTQTEDGKGSILGSILASTRSTKAFVKKAFGKLAKLLVGVGLGGAAAAYAMSVANDQEADQPQVEQTSPSTAPGPVPEADQPAPGAQLQQAEPISGESSAPPPESQNVALGPSEPRPLPSTAVGGGSLPDNPAKYLPTLPRMDAQGRVLPDAPMGVQPSIPPSANQLRPVSTPTPSAPQQNVSPEKPLKLTPRGETTQPAVERPSLAATSETTQTAETGAESATPTNTPTPPGVTTGMVSEATTSPATTPPAPERVATAPAQPYVAPSMQTTVPEPPSTENVGGLRSVPAPSSTLTPSLTSTPPAASSEAAGGLASIPQTTPSSMGGLRGVVSTPSDSGNQISSLSTLIDTLMEGGLQKIAPIIASAGASIPNMLGEGAPPLIPSPVANRGSLDIGTTFDAHA